MAVYLIIGLIILVIIFIVWTYNKLIYKKNKVENSWNQIDIQLKRRFDVIPNLVEIVKGYAQHEKNVFENVTAARNQYIQSNNAKEQIQANKDMNKALQGLYAVVENYPNLQSNENFINLQNELTKTEDKISFSRQIYNDVVMDYNNSIEMFPGNIIAQAFNFKNAFYIEIDEGDKANPVIKF